MKYTTVDITRTHTLAPFLWQWDYGQVLVFTGVELPETYEVHFVINGTDSTMTVLGTSEGVVIPDELLAEAGQVICYIYLHTGADDGETEYKITIPVLSRQEPTEYEPTPIQQDVITETIAALNVAKSEWENMTATATTLDYDEPATASYSDGVLSLGIPKGEPGSGGGAVDSVNGQTGDVVLTAADVGAMADNAQVVRYETQTLTDAQQAQARANINAISADEIGVVFNIKGDVATYNDLPQTGNTVGDVYYVADVSAGYVWLETTEHPTGYWEELGEPIDLSGYIEKPVSPTTGQFLQWNGSEWVAATYTPPVTSVNGATGAVVISNATTTTAGLMSATDKSNLDILVDDYESALQALGVI